MPDITKIVVTGGVCGGKTTALQSIRSAFTRRGYKVITIPEPATEFKTNGILPWECASDEEYQRCQMRVQLMRERCFEEAARGMDDEKILIVCDRGMLDNKYYTPAEAFPRIVDELGSTEVELRNSYDAVFHLVTAAKGAEEFYTNDNNAARHETIEEAAAMDDGFIEAWTGHPHLRVIDNSTDFEGKMRRLVHEIAYFLGEVGPYELERQFLIEMPDLEVLGAMPNCELVQMIQTYLRSDADHEIRIRKVMGKGSAYSYTEKEILGTHKRLVRRRRLTKQEYITLLAQADPERRQIVKTRYCLATLGHYYEIDVHPCWQDRAILKVDYSGDGSELVFPPEIKVIREVTEDREYDNEVIASRPAG